MFSRETLKGLDKSPFFNYITIKGENNNDG